MNFIEELCNEVGSMLKKLDEMPLIESGDDPKAKAVNLLKAALKNEIEASEIAAYWMHSAPETDVKLGLARQCGDEAKHYKLIEKRLVELGADLSGFSPLAAGYSPLFQWLKTLNTTVERIAAGPFAREAIAIKRNVQFMALLEAVGDSKSAMIYREQIQPDEEWHHNFGVEMLKKYAVTPEMQEAARNAAMKTMKTADEMRDAAIEKFGTCAIPGC